MAEAADGVAVSVVQQYFSCFKPDVAAEAQSAVTSGGYRRFRRLPPSKEADDGSEGARS